MSNLKQSSSSFDSLYRLSPVNGTEILSVTKGEDSFLEMGSETQKYGLLPSFDRYSKPVVDTNTFSKSRRKTTQLDQDTKGSPAYSSKVILSSPLPRKDRMRVNAFNGSPRESTVRRHSRQPENMPDDDISKEKSTRITIPSSAMFVLQKPVDDPEPDFAQVVNSGTGTPKQQLEDPTKHVSDLHSGPRSDQPTKTPSTFERSPGISDHFDILSDQSNTKKYETHAIAPLTVKRFGDNQFYDIENTHLKTHKIQKVFQGDGSSKDSIMYIPREQDPNSASLLEEKSRGEEVNALSEAINKVKKIQEENQIVRERFDSLQTELHLVSSILYAKDTWFRQFVTDISEKVKKFEKEKAEKAHTIPCLEKEVESVKKSLSEKLLQITVLEDDTRKLKEAVMIANLETKSLRDELTTACEQRHVLELEKDSLISQKESMSEKIFLLEKSLEEKALLNQELGVKFNSLVKDTQALNEEMAFFEREHKSLKNDLLTKEESTALLKLEKDNLRQENLNLQQKTEKFKTCLNEMEAKNGNLSAQLLEAQRQVNTLKTQTVEKDLIISGDTEKLKDLNIQVNRQKSIIAELRKETKENFAGHEKSESELMQQVVNLKAQISAAQQKSDERIQEIAEQLYHQYSKKHEVKVSQLRKNYEMKIGDKISQVNDYEKQVETLESQLKIEIKEKEYLLRVLEKGGDEKAEDGTGKEIRF